MATFSVAMLMAGIILFFVWFTADTVMKARRERDAETARCHDITIQWSAAHNKSRDLAAQLATTTAELAAAKKLLATVDNAAAAQVADAVTAKQYAEAALATCREQLEQQRKGAGYVFSKAKKIQQRHAEELAKFFVATEQLYGKNLAAGVAPSTDEQC